MAEKSLQAFHLKQLQEGYWEDWNFEYPLFSKLSDWAGNVLELAVVEFNMLPLFVCPLFHDLIAALYNKHTGTLHCWVCVEVRF